MKSIFITLGICLILSTLVVACSGGFATPISSPTRSPYPTPTAQASNVTDLFCEYDFCIGHPPDLYLKEASSLDEVEEWSTYRSGVLVGLLNDRVFVKWRVSSRATWDTSLKAKEILLTEYLPVGNVTEETMGNTTVAYIEVKDDKSDNLFPYGVSAAWYCADRGFRLLINTKREGSAIVLLKSSLERFTCE